MGVGGGVGGLKAQVLGENSPLEKSTVPSREGSAVEGSDKPLSLPFPLAALAGGPGRLAHDSRAAAGARAEPHTHPLHAGGGAGQEGRPLWVEGLACCQTLLRFPRLHPPATPLFVVSPVAWAGQRKTKMLPPSSVPQKPTLSSSSLQVQPSDSLEPEFTRKCQSLLKCWREKVFALMVQLKAQELEHRACVEQLKGQVICPSCHILSPNLLLT